MRCREGSSSLFTDDQHEVTVLLLPCLVPRSRSGALTVTKESRRWEESRESDIHISSGEIDGGEAVGGLLHGLRSLRPSLTPASEIPPPEGRRLVRCSRTASCRTHVRGGLPGWQASREDYGSLPSSSLVSSSGSRIFPASLPLLGQEVHEDREGPDNVSQSC